MAKKKANGNGGSLSLFGLELQKFYPLTENQKIAFEEYNKGKNLFLSGIAGTGKSFISLYLALTDFLKHKDTLHQIKIIKSVVQTRQIGYLPGTIYEKIKDFEVAYENIIHEIFGRDDAYSILSSKNMISFECSSFLRGRTLSDMIVIVDEAQNMTFHELDTIITRAGKNTKFIFIGDMNQRDIDPRSCGFNEFLSIIERMSSFSVITFEIEDIVRSGLVKEYLIQKHHLGK
ncbi:MAG: PhoH family protein [Patescibacteria group bacterium]|nr:PhoH family protein [Patescibacteria group bacterium]